MTNKEIIHEVTSAFVRADIETVLKYCHEDLVWTMFGYPPMHGKEPLRRSNNMENLKQPPDFNMLELIVEGDNVVSRGNMTMELKDGKTEFCEFCDIYRLKDGKIKELLSYVVDIKKSEK